VIELEANATTTPTEAYKQFIQIGEWWDSEHSWFGRSDAFSLDATAGGCFC
jgi:hypothetical protein